MIYKILHPLIYSFYFLFKSQLQSKRKVNDANIQVIINFVSYFYKTITESLLTRIRGSVLIFAHSF